jgi:hypothetical protein
MPQALPGDCEKDHATTGEGMCLSVTCQAGKTEHPDAAGHASATQPTAGAYRRLAKLMVELGWAAVRGRDLTRGGYKE